MQQTWVKKTASKPVLVWIYLIQNSVSPLNIIVLTQSASTREHKPQQNLSLCWTIICANCKH